MSETDMTEYAELRKALAEGPMPGPWADDDGAIIQDVGSGSQVASVCGSTLEHHNAANARYIAAANPETISKLLAERDALRAEMDDAREELQHVLRDWNELKQAIGSPANGGVIGHANALLAERDALHVELEKTRSAAIRGMDAATAVSYANLETAARLRAESSPEVLDSERAANAALTEEVETLRAERDALAKDAARYRWLRGDSYPDHSKRWTQWEVRCWRAPRWTDDLRRDELDDAIDAEMAGREGER